LHVFSAVIRNSGKQRKNGAKKRPRYRRFALETAGVGL